MAKDVAGLNGKLGAGEEHWPRCGEEAPPAVDVPAWPLIDPSDKGPNDGNWAKL